MTTAIPLLLELCRVGHWPTADCPGCRSPLAVHQPDEELPERLLATCEACRAWFLVFEGPGLMVRLPDEADIQPA